MTAAHDPRQRITVRYQLLATQPQRVVLEPRSEGRWLRREEAWTGCRWRTRGQELVTNLAVREADNGD